MPRYDFDMFTIGAGSGGVASSRRAGSYGARVAICEESRVGGTCVIRGCVPKKLLVYGAQFADGFAQSHEDGFTSLIHTAAGVIERIHGGVGKDEEVSIPTHSRQYVFDYAAKVVQVDR